MFSNHPKIRIGIYCLAVASQIASFFVVLTDPDLAAAFVSTSTVLTSVAGVTAVSNVPKAD